MNAILDISLISELVMVDIGLWNKNTKSFSRMLITVDTGASVTTISTDLLHALGYDVSNGKKSRIITASSVEFVNAITLEKMALGNIQLENINVYAHTFPESSFSMGVLGLNVLKQFDVYIYFSKKEIELVSTSQV
jgi:predicted aspartyl protease